MRTAVVRSGRSARIMRAASVAVLVAGLVPTAIAPVANAAVRAGGIDAAHASLPMNPAIPPPTAITNVMTPGDELHRAGADPGFDSTLISSGIPPSFTPGVPYNGRGMYLILQSDGNLVEYETSTGAALFSTHTHTATRFVFQTDGNLVLRDAAGHALFTTGTAGLTTARRLVAFGNGQLILASADGTPLHAFGTAVTPAPGNESSLADSPNGNDELVVQTDGNVVARSRLTGKAFWTTGTAGAGRARFVAQRDGNLVLYAYPSGRVLWRSHSFGPTAYYQMDMQNDGNVVLYLTDGVRRLRAVWASRTRG